MKFELITLNDQDNLVKTIAQKLKKELYMPQEQFFADGEMHMSLEDPSLFTNKTVILLQSSSFPVHEHLLRIAFLAHELKNAHAKKIIAVLPYFGYSRQEKSNIENKPGQAYVVAKLLENAGIDALVTVEIHDPVVQTFFSIPTHNISIYDQIAQDIKNKIHTLDDVCLVAPDEGAADSVQKIADKLDLGVLIFRKERYAKNKTRILGKIGTCIGKTAIIIDDIIDTAGTALNVCKELKDQDFEIIYGYFVHPVLSNSAVNKIEQGAFDKIFVANTISLPPEKQSKKIAVFDISDAIINTIKQIM